MYIHKMNQKQFTDKVEFTYRYQPKEFNVSMRAKADANMILAALKKDGVDISNDFDAILTNLPKKDYNQNDSIDWIKLSCYRKEQKKIIYSNMDFNDKIMLFKELFNKYFKISGDYMKTIELK